MLYYGNNDWMVNTTDVAQLRSELPNVSLDYLVPYPKWAHMDFVWGTEAKKYVYDKLMDVMKLYD